MLQDVSVVDIAICNDAGQPLHDHYSITCNVNIAMPKIKDKAISYRKFRIIDIQTLKSDITASLTLNHLDGSPSELADRFTTALMLSLTSCSFNHS